MFCPFVTAKFLYTLRPHATDGGSRGVTAPMIPSRTRAKEVGGPTEAAPHEWSLLSVIQIPSWFYMRIDENHIRAAKCDNIGPHRCADRAHAGVAANGCKDAVEPARMALS